MFRTSYTEAGRSKPARASAFCSRAEWRASTRTLLVLLTVFAFGSTGCRGAYDGADADAELDEALAEKAMLLANTRDPVFFLGPEADAPALGFGSEDAKLIAREDPPENGRTPVRVLGRLHLEAYVPNGVVELRVQQNTAVEGTALMLRAGDRVGLVEPRNGMDVHRITIRVSVADQILGPFEGRLSANLLSAKLPAKGSALTAGIAYTLPANQALPLYRAPQGELLTLLAPMPQEFGVTVLALERGWSLVRIGRGPYLQGFTNAPLTLVGTAAKAAQAKPPPIDTTPHNSVPWRIALTPGPLALVPAGTQLRFRNRIVATLRSSGWARGIGSMDTEDVEVFVAVDDAVAARGIVARRALTFVDESALGLTPPTGPGFAQDLSSAR